MSRRPVNSNRRLVDGGGVPFATSLQSKSQSSPLLTIGLVVLVTLFLNYRNIVPAVCVLWGWGHHAYLQISRMKNYYKIQNTSPVLISSNFCKK